MSAIVEERRKRKERGGAMQQTSDRDADKSQFTDPRYVPGGVHIAMTSCDIM